MLANRCIMDEANDCESIYLKADTFWTCGFSLQISELHVQYFALFILNKLELNSGTSGTTRKITEIILLHNAHGFWPLGWSTKRQYINRFWTECHAN
jgi:hypothetical protein